MKRFGLILGLMFAWLCVFGKSKVPVVMAVPSDAWCVQNNYMTNLESQGEALSVPDYEKALRENKELVYILDKIETIIKECELPVKDLTAAVKSMNVERVAAEGSADDKSGSAAALDSLKCGVPIKAITAREGVDILIEVAYSVEKRGFRGMADLSLKGINVHTGKQIAASQAESPLSSLGAESLLSDALSMQINGFLDQLQVYFENMVANGKSITEAD